MKSKQINKQNLAVTELYFTYHLINTVFNFWQKISRIENEAIYQLEIKRHGVSGVGPSSEALRASSFCS